MAEPYVQDKTGGLLEVLTKDLKRLQEQKSRLTGGVEARTLHAIAFSEGEHHTDVKGKTLFSEPIDPNKLYLVFNLVGKAVTKLMGRLSAIDPPYKTKPDRKDPKAYAEAEVCDSLIMALGQKLNDPARLWEVLYWLLHGGTAFVHTPWIPNATVEPMPQFGDGGELLYKSQIDGSVISESQLGQLVASGASPEVYEVYEEAEPVGDVGCEVFGPLNVFLDQGVKSIEDLAPDQRVYIAQIRTAGWIEENFGVQVEPDQEFKIVSTTFIQSGDAIGGHFLKDLIPMIQGEASPDDPPMNVVVQAYAPPSKMNPRGRYTCFVPGKAILHDDVSPYGEIPLVDIHWKPVTTSFWTANFVSDLIAPQRFLNKRMSQLGEQSNATLYSQLLLGGALSEKDISPDAPGAVKGAVSDTGAPLVQRLEPPQIPTWFMNSIELTIKLFKEIAGGTDLTEDTKFPGQLRGPMAVPMLQEIMDTEWGPFYRHLGERFGIVHQMRLNRVKGFYPPIRTLHYVGRDQKDEVLIFHADKILRSDTNFNVTVERGALMPELRALREARVQERLNSPLAILYMDERTGKLDKSKIAQDLQFGDTGREAREGQYRKLSQELIGMIWEGKAPQIPPVLPFYDHRVMMDELEAAMATTEFLKASPPIQMAFTDRWNQHQQFLMQEAMAQQQALQNGMIQNAVAQATQQAAAQAAADAVTSTQSQMQAQDRQPTEEYVRSAQDRAQANRRPDGPPNKRKLTIEEDRTPPKR